MFGRSVSRPWGVRGPDSTAMSSAYRKRWWRADGPVSPCARVLVPSYTGSGISVSSRRVLALDVEALGPPLNEKLFPVDRLSGFQRVFLFFFHIFGKKLFFSTKILYILVSKKLHMKKKRFPPDRFFMHTRWTGNDNSCKDGLGPNIPCCYLSVPPIIIPYWLVQSPIFVPQMKKSARCCRFKSHNDSEFINRNSAFYRPN